MNQFLPRQKGGRGTALGEGPPTGKLARPRSLREQRGGEGGAIKKGSHSRQGGPLIKFNVKNKHRAREKT